MKILFTLSLFIPFGAFSRNYSDDEILNYLQWGSDYVIGYQWASSIFYYSNANTVKKNKVHTVVCYNIKKNGKKEVETKKIFNERGKLIQMVGENETIDFVFTDTLLTEIIRTIKSNVWHTECSYDDQNRVVNIRKKKNEKLLTETTYTYFEDQKTTVVEQKNFNGKQKVYRYETDYDPLLKRPIESRYLINGELDTKWTYSCDEKGKAEKSEVTEVTQCMYNAANNDGSYVVFSRTIKDNEIYLQETTFSKDSVFMEYKRFYKDTILVSHQAKSGNTSTYESFKKNGKFQSKTINQFDERGNNTGYQYFNRRQKETSYMKAKYSENDLVEEVSYRMGSGLSFEYTFY